MYKFHTVVVVAMIIPITRRSVTTVSGSNITDLPVTKLSTVAANSHVLTVVVDIVMFPRDNRKRPSKVISGMGNRVVGERKQNAKVDNINADAETKTMMRTQEKTTRRMPDLHS
jgi:hypothetical protein